MVDVMCGTGNAAPNLRIHAYMDVHGPNPEDMMFMMLVPGHGKHHETFRVLHILRAPEGQ